MSFNQQKISQIAQEMNHQSFLYLNGTYSLQELDLKIGSATLHIFNPMEKSIGSVTITGSGKTLTGKIKLGNSAKELDLSSPVHIIPNITTQNIMKQLLQEFKKIPKQIT